MTSIHVAELFTAAVASAQLQIAFDYTYDTGGFFADSLRRGVLEMAAHEFTSRFDDALAPIVPMGTDTWRASLIRPDLGTSVNLQNFIVPQDALIVFVGARVFGGDILAVAGPGGSVPTGSAAWRSLVRTRGQAGAPATDFGPWGGSIAFDNSAASRWYFDADPASIADLPTGADDFYSVALHELGHLMGIGVAGSWYLQANGNFTGHHAILAFGSPIPLDLDGSHWAEGTMSRALDTGLPQEAAFDPTLDLGTRKFLTNLDLAALNDIGWQVVPEPSATMLFITTAGAATGLRFRRGKGR